jgi:hypothetical protein
MDNRGLIFIPDISGFTRFVNEVEIDHSRHIIQELLETIINANQLGLEISEIEGDAILFYKYGEKPQLEDIYKQVEKMFCEFHKHLVAYDHRRLCQCKACAGAIELTLKVITHYGEFTGYNVKNFSKLIGKDIIVAHQLLKNDIEQHEYWLVTEGLAEKKIGANLPDKLDWNKSSKKTETGIIPFEYTQLTHLKNELPPDPPLQLEIENKIKVISIYKEFDTDMLTLLHGVVDFHTRKLWNNYVRDIDSVSTTLPQLGTSHRCILEKGHSIMYTSSYSYTPANTYTPEKIEYSETDDKKTNAVYFTFDKIHENRTALTADLYLKNDPVKLLLFRLFMKKKMEKTFRQSMENLEKFLSKTPEPAEAW